MSDVNRFFSCPMSMHYRTLRLYCSLCCDFDEFPQQLRPLIQRVCQADFRYNPTSNLVETSQKDFQICCDPLKTLATEHVVDQLILKSVQIRFALKQLCLTMWSKLKTCLKRQFVFMCSTLYGLILVGSIVRTIMVVIYVHVL